MGVSAGGAVDRTDARPSDCLSRVIHVLEPQARAGACAPWPVGSRPGLPALACQQFLEPGSEPDSVPQLWLQPARHAAAGLANLCRNPVQPERALVALSRGDD